MMAPVHTLAVDPDQRVAETYAREASRLGRFIRGRVADAEVAEEIMQDVFADWIETEQLLAPIEHIGSWLYRVARNRITDWLRRKKPERLAESEAAQEGLSAEDTLPSPEGGTEEDYEQALVWAAIEAALAELPEAQRAVFIAHEMQGKSFIELAAQSGERINTLLSRKHAAVQHLRHRLQGLYDEWDL